ncbi:MAG TPA: alpha-L-fucosidase [Clostridiales bacterium]|nr:alpha-L-fucosidase [Clostridiales bacterium]
MKIDPVAERASKVVPSERQLKWQELEFYAFVHFGMNTFTNSEWGPGFDPPELFNPTKLDARQWVSTFKAAGMRAVILTAKHHDGFCLWPSAYTDYSVKYSPWKDGEGDVVKELSDACREYGLKFGFYLSPWDRHDARYGEGEAYNKYFRNQLTELLTHYGDVFCVWFDGACGEGKKGRKQDYDWQSYYELIRELQPEAVISIMGPDVRWIGNEAGVTRKSEWSVVPYYYSNADLIAAQSQQSKDKPPKEINHTNLDLGSRRAIKNVEKLIWYPAEVDVSIRKSWFYHQNDDITVKPLSKLLDIYYSSVGGNAALLLNVPPNKEGLLAQRDVDVLIAMGAQLAIDFNENLADDSEMTASCQLDDEHGPQKALSASPDDYWHSGIYPEDPWIMIDLGDDYDIDKVVLGEHLRTGQQIEKFKLLAEVDGKWKQMAEGTTIGYKKICRFEETRMRYIKLVIESTRCFATISKFEAY